MSTCVVTAGTSGIGRSIAERLVRGGHTVIVVGRDAERGAAAASALSAVGPGSAAFEPADLLDAGSVRALAGRLRERWPRIDVLVNNAGGSFWERGLSPDGLERTIALNLRAPVLLTRELLPALGPGARVVNVATRLQRGMALDLSDPLSERRYRGFDAYAGAKVALVAWSLALGRELAPRGVAVHAVHPGIVNGTSFGADMPSWMRSLGAFVSRVLRFETRVEDASDTPVWLATAPEVAGEPPGYWAWRARLPLPRQVEDPAGAGSLVTFGEGLVGAS
jgi:retinol dehydrogenase-12